MREVESLEDPVRASPASASGEVPLLEVEGLSKHFPARGGPFGRRGDVVRAVDGVSFEIRRGETLGLVGESGSGKTTIGRLILRLIEPSAGDIRFEGESLVRAARGRVRALRGSMQIVFQSAQASMNPRMRVEDLVGEGLLLRGVRGRRARRPRVEEALRAVGVDPRTSLERYPHEFSGGQLQRIGIARALVLEPRFVVWDEAASSLDPSLAAQVLRLAVDLQAARGLTYLFISHDLAVVDHLSDRVAVLYLGRLVECGPSAMLRTSPRHPYTAELLRRIPRPPEETGPEPGSESVDASKRFDPVRACAYHPRCPLAVERCRQEVPGPTVVGPDHLAWCFRAEEGLEGLPREGCGAGAPLGVHSGSPPRDPRVPERPPLNRDGLGT